MIPNNTNCHSRKSNNCKRSFAEQKRKEKEKLTNAEHNVERTETPHIKLRAEHFGGAFPFFYYFRFSAVVGKFLQDAIQYLISLMILIRVASLSILSLKYSAVLPTPYVLYGSRKSNSKNHRLQDFPFA